MLRHRLHCKIERAETETYLTGHLPFDSANLLAVRPATRLILSSPLLSTVSCNKCHSLAAGTCMQVLLFVYA